MCAKVAGVNETAILVCWNSPNVITIQVCLSNINLSAIAAIRATWCSVIRISKLPQVGGENKKMSFQYVMWWAIYVDFHLHKYCDPTCKSFQSLGFQKQQYFLFLLHIYQLSNSKVQQIHPRMRYCIVDLNFRQNGKSMRKCMSFTKIVCLIPLLSPIVSLIYMFQCFTPWTIKKQYTYSTWIECETPRNM